jgi:hypothetical protein
MNVERLEEIASDAKNDAELYAKKAREADNDTKHDYYEGASWAFGVIAQRVVGDVTELLTA